MKTRYILLAAACLAFFSCKVEEFKGDDALSAEVAPGAVVYTFNATISDPVTRSYFEESEAPSKYIYWEDSDVFDFHDIIVDSETAESVSVSSKAPDVIAQDKKSVVFEKAAHDYMVITYPKDAIQLQSNYMYSEGSGSNYKEYLTSANQFAFALVNVPREQKLTNVLSPENVPMASKRLALSDRAKEAVASGKDSISIAYDGAPVEMVPLAGLVKMHLTDLGVASAKISKVSIVTEFDSKSTTGLPQFGIRGESYFSLADTMAVAKPFVSGDSRFIVNLSTDTPIEYTAEKGIDICFVANHSYAGMKTMLIKVYTDDSSYFVKKFDMSGAKVNFSKSHISSFTLNFKDGTTSRVGSTRFSVEWSKGYLTYDAENKAYKFAQPDEVGLYFKFGSSKGVFLYSNTEDYDSRIKPASTSGGISIGGNIVNPTTEDGQTIANGSCYWYNVSPSSGLNASWRTRAYCAPDAEGKIVIDSLRTWEEYNALEGTSSFAGATDPCSYVKVADGEKAWRVPTEAEVTDMITAAGAGAEFGNLDGSDIISSDGKPRYFKVYDGEQVLVFKACGSATEGGNRNTYQLQMLYSNKYAIRFWTTAYASTKGDYFNFSLSSVPSPTTELKASFTKANAGSANNYTPTKTVWEATMVRCIRDK